MNEYPRPWHLQFHLAWFVVDDNGGIVAGPFGNQSLALEWVRRNYSEKWLGEAR